MAGSVYKVIEIIGTSDTSWEEAAKSAVEEAADSLDDLRVAEVVQLDMHIVENKVAAYRAKKHPHLLVGIGASLSTQVLARRKEFGLLAHLGLTRRQVLALVCGEAAAWLAVGTLLGVALGIAVAVVLVYVVNPQSFHWTMELVLPPTRLGALAAAVLAAGVATSALAARGAVARRAVLSVKEDW